MGTGVRNCNVEGLGRSQSAMTYTSKIFLRRLARRVRTIELATSTSIALWTRAFEFVMSKSNALEMAGEVDTGV